MDKDFVQSIQLSKAGRKLSNKGTVQRMLEYAKREGIAPKDVYQFLNILQFGAQINHDISYAADEVSLHNHGFYEVLFVCQGSNVQYLLDNSRYQLQKGDVVLIPPGMGHRPLFLGTLTEPYERYALWIDADFFESQSAMFPELGFALEQCRSNGSWLLRSTKATYSGLYAGFNMLWIEQDSQKFGWQATVALGAINLMVHISRTFYYRHMDVAKTEEHSLFDEVFSYIDTHLGEKLTLAHVAGEFHVSFSTISHLFQKQMGISFYQCVIQRRLIRAKNHILQGMALKEVWEACGFPDYSSFYRLFKKEYGVSPRQFRQLNK